MEILWATFCRREYGSNLNHFNVHALVQTDTEFGDITQINGHYTVQGHSRSPLWVLIESPYVKRSAQLQ